MEAAHAISIRNLSFSYERNAPKVIDIEKFDITKGSHTFLHGPSGSGKSTLLALFTGTLRATQGSIEILGQNISKFGSHKMDTFRGAHMGYIFQMLNLLPFLSARENIELAVHFSPLRKSRLKKNLAQDTGDLAQKLGIADLLEKNVLNLSVGQQQRVAVARALIGSPEIIIADEPTSALDHAARDKFLELLFNQCEERGSTLIFVSHDPTLKARFTNQVRLEDLQKSVPGAPG